MTSPTAAGRTDTRPPSDEQVDAINQVFALFRVNFHNQYYAAFSDTQLLNQTKKLWLDSLKGFTSDQILRGAKRAIEQSEYLPTLHKMITFCQGDLSTHGLPTPHQAYVEACQAPTPKATHEWSHPAVYYAGRDTGWYFLATNAEYVALPVFREQYRLWCDKVMQGEHLPPIDTPRLEEDTGAPLSKTENKQRLQKLRKSLEI